MRAAGVADAVVAPAEAKLRALEAKAQKGKVARPSDAAVQRLLEKVGVGSLEEAVGAETLAWNGRGLDDEDAKVVAYVVATSGSLTVLGLGGNTIGDVGAKRCGMPSGSGWASS